MGMFIVASKPLGRFDAAQNEWHRHAVEHVHDASDSGDDQEHAHLFATDQDTFERLKRLLRHAAKGPLTADYRREAAALLELML